MLDDLGFPIYDCDCYVVSSGIGVVCYDVVVGDGCVGGCVDGVDIVFGDGVCCLNLLDLQNKSNENGVNDIDKKKL